MPYDDPDPTDPMTLHGVVLETDTDEANREMAECFIEEYLRMGFDRDRLMKMFRSEAYAGPFMALRALGAEAISRLIEEIAARRVSHAARIVDQNEKGEILLPQLER